MIIKEKGTITHLMDEVYGTSKAGNPYTVREFVIEINEEYLFTKTEHTVSAKAMLVDAMLSGGVSGKDAVAAVLADENNSYSKNELKAALLNLKRLI